MPAFARSPVRSSRDAAHPRAAAVCLALATLSATASADLELDLPGGFAAATVLEGLADPATMAFAPDGRLFIAERIQGRLRVAVPDGAGGYDLLAEPFHVFEVPHDGTGVPERHRSSGLRGFDFDPDFAANGRLHAFVMRHVPRHNHVVTIAASEADPNVSTGAETSLLELPFNATESSGSHNGGAVVATDEHLFVTTGDGWNGGDDVQSLSTWTGKILRLGLDGSIPDDNPFAGEAEGDFRAIHALGLRNPFTASRRPATGAVFVHDVRGSGKAAIDRVVAGANHGHDGDGGIGTPVDPWANASLGTATGRVVTGGDWAPDCGNLGPAYAGDLFLGLYGGNGASAGAIVRVTPGAAGGDPVTTAFATNVRRADAEGTLRPVALRFGPGGRLFLLMSSYEAQSGSVHVIERTGPSSPDLDADGSVGIGDLLAILAAWGPCAGSCAADLDGDCLVGLGDLILVLAGWS